MMTHGHKSELQQACVSYDPDLHAWLHSNMPEICNQEQTCTIVWAEQTCSPYIGACDFSYLPLGRAVSSCNGLSGPAAGRLPGPKKRLGGNTCCERRVLPASSSRGGKRQR